MSYVTLTVIVCVKCLFTMKPGVSSHIFSLEGGALQIVENDLKANENNCKTDLN